MNVRIDQTMCIRCGMCHEICPEVFLQKEAGEDIKMAFMTIPVEYEEACLKAEANCEKGVIIIES
jgi:ferredoxin